MCYGWERIRPCQSKIQVYILTQSEISWPFLVIETQPSQPICTASDLWGKLLRKLHSRRELFAAYSRFGQGRLRNMKEEGTQQSKLHLIVPTPVERRTSLAREGKVRLGIAVRACRDNSPALCEIAPSFLRQAPAFKFCPQPLTSSISAYILSFSPPQVPQSPSLTAQ